MNLLISIILNSISYPALTKVTNYEDFTNAINELTVFDINILTIITIFTEFLKNFFKKVEGFDTVCERLPYLSIILKLKKVKLLKILYSDFKEHPFNTDTHLLTVIYSTFLNQVYFLNNLRTINY